MADSAIGFERSIDASVYSPVAGGERAPRSGTEPIETDYDSPSEMASLIKLGTLRLEMGNEKEAEEFFRRALELGDSSLGPEHPNLMLLLNDLTRLYLKQSAYTQAEPLLLRLLGMKRSKGEDHPEVATVLASLATVRQALGSHESAEQLWRRVLDIRERTLAPNHFATVTALEHLGDACAARGKIREGVAALQRALTIRERTLGSDHASLRVSRERIADLELQASGDSLDPPGSTEIPSTPERYRLLPSESLGITPGTSMARQKNTATLRSKAALMIQRPLTSEPAAKEDAAVQDEAQIGDVATFQPDAAPYRDTLESIREELERPYQSDTLRERTAAIFGLVATYLGKRQVAATIAVGVIVLLLLAVATNSHAWGELDQTAGIGTLPNYESRATAVPSASIGELVTTTGERVGGPASTRSAVSRVAAPRSRVTEERSSPKKGTEQRTDSKKIAIPTVSNALMSGLDSVASRAASAPSRAGDPFSVQLAPSALGTQRSSFDYGEAAITPQPARLIGDVPTPRVPDQVAGVEGEVRVRFTVDTAGRPVMSTLTVVNSPHPLLTAAVGKVIPGMRFEPARNGGSDSKPIIDVVQIRFQFVRNQR
jgi:TonB family protein